MAPYLASQRKTKKGNRKIIKIKAHKKGKSKILVQNSIVHFER